MNPRFSANGVEIYHGDCREVLRALPDESAHCVVTSPPYWGLRDYGCDGQIGLEDSPIKYISTMREVFAEVRRVLRSDGTLWLNMGDSYNAGTSAARQESKSGAVGRWQREETVGGNGRINVGGLKAKDLVGIPWMLAFALREDGWYLRQDIIWSKPNPMPESVTDRCTKAHEYLFLLAKSERYYYNAEAIKEAAIWSTSARQERASEDHKSMPDEKKNGIRPKTAGINSRIYQDRDPNHPSERKVKISGGWDRGNGAHGTIHRNGRTSAEYQDLEVPDSRNKRSVWSVATAPFPGAHFATFPEDLIKPCILAGCVEGGTVLDPFMGSGTTGLVARKLHCKAIGIELNEEYIAIASRRLSQEVFNFAQ